jgi:cullin 1
VYERVKQKAVAALLDLIKRDRDAEQGVDRDLLRDAIQIFVEMGMGDIRVYRGDFEVSFIDATNSYYTRQASSWLAGDSCPEYMRKAETRILQEKKRMHEYLHSSTDEPLMETLYQTLLVRHQNDILDKENTGVRAMLRAHAEQGMRWRGCPLPSRLLASAC